MTDQIDQRVVSIRKWLSENNYDALIIPHEDEYLGEYVPDYNERLCWATGFTGSAGVAVITRHSAAIFVDGRYTVQVKSQVPESVFEYRHLIEDPFLEWIIESNEQITNVAFDPRMHTASWHQKALSVLGGDIALSPIQDNPVDSLWLDRPEQQNSDIRLLEESNSGKSSSEKRTEVAGKISANGADAVVLTQLDSICWLLNIRGLDVSRLPVVLSHAILYSDSSLDLFVSPDRVPEGFSEHTGEGVRVLDPSLLQDSLTHLSGKSAMLDPATSNAWFSLVLEDAGAKIVEEPDPCLLPKSAKNPTEVQGMKDSHIKDGVAMVRFLAWLDEEVDAGHLHDEAALSDKLQNIRELDSSLVDLSFDTISAAGPNAAMCHYNHLNQEVPGSLEMNSLYLVDSGGQYINGTTDITRTIAIGKPTDEMKRLFTLVLKGHISLATGRFPKGTTGSQLDVLARQHLWAHGFDYDHGTGHGVGHFLSVHEGPQRIAKVPNTVALLPGMVLSNEPGYYREDRFGIRIENLELVVEYESDGDFSLLGFEPLTLCPIDKRNIDVNLLTKPELKWLNNYHNKVWSALSPLLSEKENGWLKNATSPMIHN